MTGCRYCGKQLPVGLGRPRVICAGRRCRKLYQRDYAAERRRERGAASNLRAVVSKSRQGRTVVETLECGHQVAVLLSRSRIGNGRRRCGACALTSAVEQVVPR